MTHGWLDFHPPILGQMVGNPTNPRWNIHPMDGFPSSGWNSIHTGWISNRMDGNPTIRPSLPWCSGEQVDGDAEVVLAGAKNHEVFGEVGGEEEEERR